MFDPDKLNDFLRKQANAMQDAILKGNKASFDAFFAKLQDAGVFKQPGPGNPNQGFGAQEKAMEYVFGKNFQKMRLNIKDFEGQLTSLEKLFNNKILRMFAPLRQILNATDTGSKFNRYMHYKQRVTMEKQTIDRLTNQENKLETLRMMYQQKFKEAMKAAKGDVDKMVDAEAKYGYKVAEINKKLRERRTLLDQVSGLHTKDSGMLALAKSDLIGRLVRESLKGMLYALALQFASGYRELRRRGEGGTQSATNVFRAFGSQFSLLGQGVFATNTDVAKNIGELGNQLGTTNVAGGLAQNATYLSEHMKMSAEQAGRLNNIFYRVAGFSDKTARSWTNISVNMAYDNMYPAATLMRDMADDSDIFARHASQGVQAFAKGEMLTKRMGTNMKSMEGFADRLVGDFENSLRMTAELQTYMPDFDMSEIMFASQFGTTADVMKAVATQLQGRDVSAMPRSFQMAIQRATGLSFTELTSISKGTPLSNVKEGNDDKFRTGEAFATSVMDFISANARVIVALNVLAGVASSVAARMGLSSGITGGLSRMGMVAGGLGAGLAGVGQYMSSRSAGRGRGASALQGLVTGGLTFGGGLLGQALIPIPGVGFVVGSMVGGALSSMGMSMLNAHVKHSGGMVGSSGLSRSVSSLSFLGAGRFHGGLLPNEFPTILQRGEAVLTNPQQRHIANVTSVALEAAKAGELLSKGYAAQNMYSGNDSANVETLLRQLIHQVKQGQVIHMDGKKVGGSIINAYSRDS